MKRNGWLLPEISTTDPSYQLLSKTFQKLYSLITGLERVENKKTPIINKIWVVANPNECLDGYSDMPAIADYQIVKLTDKQVVCEQNQVFGFGDGYLATQEQWQEIEGLMRSIRGLVNNLKLNPEQPQDYAKPIPLRSLKFQANPNLLEIAEARELIVKDPQTALETIAVNSSWEIIEGAAIVWCFLESEEDPRFPVAMKGDCFVRDEEFKALLPRPEQERFEALVADIETHGFIDPLRGGVIVDDSNQPISPLILMDGYTRDDIALLLNKPLPPIKAFSFHSREEMKLQILAWQGSRRNADQQLLESKKSTIALKYAIGKIAIDALEEKQKKLGRGSSVKQIASRFDVNERYVEQAISTYRSIHKVIDNFRFYLESNTEIANDLAEILSLPVSEISNLLITRLCNETVWIPDSDLKVFGDFEQLSDQLMQPIIAALNKSETEVPERKFNRVVADSIPKFKVGDTIILNPLEDNQRIKNLKQQEATLKKYLGSGDVIVQLKSSDRMVQVAIADLVAPMSYSEAVEILNNGVAANNPGKPLDNISENPVDVSSVAKSSNTSTKPGNSANKPSTGKPKSGDGERGLAEERQISFIDLDQYQSDAFEIDDEVFEIKDDYLDATSEDIDRAIALIESVELTQEQLQRLRAIIRDYEMELEIAA